MNMFNAIVHHRNIHDLIFDLMNVALIIIWVGKVIHWGLYKKFKSDHTNKWYIHYTESVLENKTQKLLRDHLISTRLSDSQQKKKKKKKKKGKKKRGLA